MNADQALELVLDGTTDELDSGDETDMNEDASFPLPVDEESEYGGNFFPVQSVSALHECLALFPEPILG